MLFVWFYFLDSAIAWRVLAAGRVCEGSHSMSWVMIFWLSFCLQKRALLMTNWIKLHFTLARPKNSPGNAHYTCAIAQAYKRLQSGFIIHTPSFGSCNSRTLFWLLQFTSISVLSDCILVLHLFKFSHFNVGFFLQWKRLYKFEDELMFSPLSQVLSES